MDGFPVYGLLEPDGSAARALDEYNGHTDPADGYRYHSALTFPYINGGLRCRVRLVGDAFAVTLPIRPAGAPLRGATITAFTSDGATSHLEYRLNGGTYRVDYTVAGRTRDRSLGAARPARARREPSRSGWLLGCAQLRAEGIGTPVSILTARRRADDLRVGFKGGGDDYVTKPFSLDELLFRVEAVLRRSQSPLPAAGDGSGSDRLRHGQLIVDVGKFGCGARESNVS